MKSDQTARIKLVSESDWQVIIERVQFYQNRIKSLEEERLLLDNSYRQELREAFKPSITG